MLLLVVSGLSILSLHRQSPCPAPSLLPLAVTLPPLYLFLSLCPCSQPHQLLPSTKYLVSDISFPVFPLWVFCTHCRHSLAECHWHNFYPHPFLIFILHAQSLTQMELVCLLPPLWCLSFSKALAWLSCKGMQQNSCLAFFSSAFSKPWIKTPNPYKGYILYPFPMKDCSFLTSHFLHSPLWQAPHVVNNFKQKWSFGL